MMTATRSLTVRRMAGAIGVIALLGIMQAAKRGWGTMSVIDALADATLRAVPTSVFDAMIDVLGTQAKTLLYVVIVFAVIAIGAWFAGRLSVDARRPHLVWARAMRTAALVFAILAALLWSIRGGDPGREPMRTFLVLAVGAIVYALLALGLPAVVEQDGIINRRRRSLVKIAAGTALLGGMGVVIDDVRHLATRTVTGSDSRGARTPAITPNGEFYTISKNFGDPDVSDVGSEWAISVSGMLDAPRAFSLSELRALSEEQHITTMLCISNEVGGDLIGTAKWTGLPIGAVLNEAGLRNAATRVIFRGLDDYSTAVPIERVMDPDAWLVWGMNDEPLPKRHGAPLRAMIPGLYGMKSVKWLLSMEATTDDYQGFWEERGWTNDAVIKPMSRIDVPLANEVLTAGPIEIAGVAFAGEPGVERVEISTDGGDSWREAEIVEQPNGHLTWAIWTYAWQAEEGVTELVVRMIDGDGETQTAEQASQLPDGASGWHRVRVSVV